MLACTVAPRASVHTPSSHCALCRVDTLHPLCSRLGQAKVVFHPYNTEQIQTIIKHRLTPVPNVFDDGAVRLAARKVGGVSGDVRRSLELLRQASELWQRDMLAWEAGSRQGVRPGAKVAMKHAAEAHKAMFSAAHFTVRSCLAMS